MPVNIKDILDSPDEKLKIEDCEAHMVIFLILSIINFQFFLLASFIITFYFRLHLLELLKILNQSKQMFLTP